MKKFKDLDPEKYNNLFTNLEYLRSHETIGDEDADYNGIYHVHWRGVITDKHILTVKSILATQNNPTVYFWIEDSLRAMTSPSYGRLMQFSKHVEVKVFDDKVIDMLDVPPATKSKIKQYYNMMGYADVRYRSDVFRFIVLTVFGGVYLDLDMLLLRDLTDIHVRQWCSKMGPGSELGDGAILKLEKGNKDCEQIYLNDPNNPQCYVISNALDYKHENLDIVSFPNAFFDILWGHPHSQDGKRGLEIDGIRMEDFPEFFERTDDDVSLDTFFRGCFAYHWHNRWEAPEYRDSYAGKLNASFDEVIREKYGITPAKIFQA